MKSLLTWLVLAVPVSALCYLDPGNIRESLQYPMSIWHLIAAIAVLFALPCSLAAAIVFVLKAAPRPHIQTVLATLCAAFVVILTCMTIAWLAMRALDNPVVRRADLPRLTEILIATMVAFFLLTFLTPPIVDPRQRRLIFGLWWRPVLTLVLLYLLFVGLSLVADERLSEVIARFAESRGGHYYTYLNAVGPTIVTGIALAAATQLGSAWARTYRARSGAFGIA